MLHFDHADKRWRCTCGDCRMYCDRMRWMLVLVLWDLDKLLLLARTG